MNAISLMDYFVYYFLIDKNPERQDRTISLAQCSSPDTIGEVLIRGKFYDSNGQLIHLGDGNTRLSALRPGEKTPFLIPINDASISRSIANYILGPEIQLSFVINKIT